MKITDGNIKKLISLLGFVPEDGCDNIYLKEYLSHNNYIIRINFNTRRIEYRAENISEQDGIAWGDATTSNFENSENFVVLECVNRLLEKGYAPNSITLEKKYPLGRNLKGKVDIVVADSEGTSFLMVECKTWGQEYEKEKKKMLKDFTLRSNISLPKAISQIPQGIYFVEKGSDCITIRAFFWQGHKDLNCHRFYIFLTFVNHLAPFLRVFRTFNPPLNTMLNHLLPPQ